MLWKVLGGFLVVLGMLFVWVLRFAIFLVLCIYVGLAFVGNLEQSLWSAFWHAGLTLIIGGLLSGLVFFLFSWIGGGLVLAGSACFERAEREPQDSTSQNIPLIAARQTKGASTLGMNPKTQRTVFIVAGVVLAFVLGGMEGSIGFWNYLLFLVVETFLVLYGGYLWTKLKARHWAWMFTMLVWPVGILVLFLMKDKSTVGGLVTGVSQTEKMVLQPGGEILNQPQGATEATACFFHPDRDAVNRCSKCGQAVCSECTYVTGTNPICRNCWDKRVSA